MEQMKNQPARDSQECKHSDTLMQQIMSQPCDLADLWGRAADSFSQNKRRRRVRDVVIIVIGVIIGVIAMHFLASPERWIRL